MSRKAHVVTFGCQMNRQEASVMSSLLGRAGYSMTEAIDEASLVVLETCAIRQKAEDKVYSLLGRLKKRRAAGETLKIAVCGCMVTEDAAHDLVRRHGVNVVLGPRRIARIADAMEHSEPVVDIGGEWMPPPEDVSAPDVPGYSAFVTVMQGCSNACTFCVVPSRRGRAESKSVDAIFAEVRSLEEKGYREVTLLGQNISYYGLDQPKAPRLIDLLTRLDRESKISQIRFATSHPAYIDRRFIDGFATFSRVMPHLHLPVQSGSNRILKAMRRGYTVERYIEIIDAIRALRPETLVTTDIITGFDGETHEDHAATLELVRRAKFQSAYVFAYSERPGTAAGDRPHASVPKEERLRRCTEVLTLIEDLKAA